MSEKIEQIKPHVGMIVWKWEHAYQIIGETSRSWIVQAGYGEEKVPKKTFPEYPTWFLTKAESDEYFRRERWEWGHGREIKRRVNQLGKEDYETLKKVAEAIGYKEEENEKYAFKY